MTQNTALTCPDCGAAMTACFPAQVKVRGPRHSKKSRLREKFRKQWLSRLNHADIARILVAPLRRAYPKFQCTGCNRVDGYYATIGRSMWK